MYETVKIGIIGGDMRQIALARRLGDLGFECAAWGLGRGADIGNAVRCSEWHSAVEKSRAVILPLPASRDGIVVNAPLAYGEEIRLSHLIRSLSADTILIGGKFDLRAREIAKERNIRVIDYFDSEELQIKNAVPTAEGAIEIAMHEMPITLFGSNALVLGYGRIGKVLLAMLRNFCAEVTVAARKQSDLAYIAALGGNAVSYWSDEYFEAAKNSDLIINTVPAKVLGWGTLEKLEKCKLIIDLASGDGGTDFDSADKLGIKTIHALSLPGKVAPVTAGNIICDCVLEILKANEGGAKI